jgi:hypothetical protein
MFRISTTQLSPIGSGAVITLMTRLDSTGKLKKISELLVPVVLSLVESDRIVTVITAPDPIQLASRVESGRIGRCDHTFRLHCYRGLTLFFTKRRRQISPNFNASKTAWLVLSPEKGKRDHYPSSSRFIMVPDQRPHRL